jgi:gag-polypeptide of LTR copia-type
MAPPTRSSQHVRARAAAQAAAQPAPPVARCIPSNVPSAASNATTECGADDDEKAPADEALDDPHMPTPPPNRRRVRRVDHPPIDAFDSLSELKPSILPARPLPPAESISRFHIPPLEQDGSNFTVWRFHIRTALMVAEIDEVLVIPCPNQILDPAGFITWKRMDRHAWGTIIFSLTGAPARTIMFATSAKDCLDKLAIAYEGKGASKLSTLMGKIFSTPMTDTEPLGPQIDAIIEAAHGVAEKGSPLGDAHIAYAIMMALPSSLETLKTVLDSLSPADQNPESVKARILSDERRRIRASGDTAAAFYAKVSKKEKKSDKDSDKKKKKKKKKCTHCNGAGHDVKTFADHVADC